MALKKHGGIAFALALTTCTAHSSALNAMGIPSFPGEADEVTSLPGWQGVLPSKHYSGYLTVRGGENHVHYYLQLSEGNPDSDPLTLWSNGGPGCTSLKGAFEELGQLVFNRDSVAPNASTNDAPTLFYNPVGWTRLSSMLYFEHPTGVGFSYCQSCLGNSSCKCFANDTTAAEDNYEALQAFFTKFPQFKQNKFFITGESYAGIYMSMLMGQIMTKGGVDNLVGAAIGNGCTGNVVGICAFGGALRAKAVADYYYGGGFYSSKLRTTILNACEGPGLDRWSSPACTAALAEMNKEVGPHNLYNMMDFCPTAELSIDEWTKALEPRSDGTAVRMDEPIHRSGKNHKPSLIEDDSMPLGERQRWCGVDSAMNLWLGVEDVKVALHVDKPKGTEVNNLAYHKGGADDLTDLYRDLAKKYRLWIYNGQEDGCVPYNGMEAFTISLGFPEVSAWHPWFGESGAGGSRVAAGYATQYGGDSKDLAFITVKGAGHEVPTYKPVAAYDLFAAFLNGTAL